MAKCTPKPGGYSETHCDALTAATQGFHAGATARSKRLFVASMVNTTTHESLGTRVVLKSGDYTKNGIVLNVCPFCGGGLIDDER